MATENGSTPAEGQLKAPKQRALTLHEVQQFFNEKKAFNGCPCCSQTAWTLIDAPPEFIWNFGSNMTNGGYVMPAPSIPVILLACNNCNFIRPHAALPIIEHIDKTNASKP